MPIKNRSVEALFPEKQEQIQKALRNFPVVYTFGLTHPDGFVPQLALIQKQWIFTIFDLQELQIFLQQKSASTI